MMTASTADETKVPRAGAPEDIDSEREGESTSRIKSDRAPFSSISREINEEDLESPGVRRMLLHIMDRLEERISELRDFEDRYNSTNTEVAILKERAKRSASHEVLSVACFVISGPIIASAINIYSKSPSISILLFITWFALLLCGAVAKAVKS